MSLCKNKIFTPLTQPFASFFIFFTKTTSNKNMEKKLLSTVTKGLLIVAFSWGLLSCEKNHDPIYEGYGLVNKLGDNKFSVTLDDGSLIYPRESFISPSQLKDSTRLYMHFNILEENDSCAFVRLTYADSILVKSILPYQESAMDSVGNDPVKITHAWFAHGFLNFEFMFAGRAHLDANRAHMVNLVQYPSENNKLVFEFCHNDFDDYRDKVYIGVVSFRINQTIEDLPKPVEMVVKFNDSANTNRSINLTYK